MFSRMTKWFAAPVFFIAGMTFIANAAIFDPPMPDPLMRKANMNMKWRFYQGTPTGTPQAVSYNDSGAGWTLVNAPHSASYDAAPRGSTGTSSWTTEANYYKGTCWYRKTFGIPLSAKKVFIEFEGAMQVTTVYVNGTQVGQHLFSGYTPFYYDISSLIVRGANNVVALSLNNAYNNDIPPGSSSGRPDFLLYSGLCRAVWLHGKDSVYVPIYSQHVRTINVSASSAQIRAITPVRNDALAAKSVTAEFTLFNAANATVVTSSMTISIPAGTLDTFDMTTGTFTPALWSPSNPYLYKAQTLLRVGGVVVDSVVEPCGVRWFTWTAASGFYLNGSRLEIQGVCAHQQQGWIENAVPDSRYFQEVKQIKAMGANSIRCAHYPRAQAFYDACDRLGLLIYVEIPSWGWGYTPTATWWTRADSCAKWMVLSARNHPCVYIWGLYNEPVPNPYVSFATPITTMNNVVKAIDPDRFTATSNIYSTAYGGTGWNPSATIPDVVGLNYSTTFSSTAYRWVGTESSDDFYRPQIRGSAADLDTSSTSWYQREWNCINFTQDTVTVRQLAGGAFWCWKDYNSPCNTNGNEGIVDRICVPKTVYYKFRAMWTSPSIPTDNPIAGTATRIELLADTMTLRANEANVFLITATMRNANGRQISSDSGNVTFTVTPSAAATFYGGNVVRAYGGRAGALLKTATTPASITLSAAYGTLPTASIILTTQQDTNQVPPYTATAVTTAALLSSDRYQLKVTSTVKGLMFRCPPAAGKLTIVNCMGRTVYSREVAQGEQVLISRRALGSGLLYGIWEGANRRVSSRVNVM